MNLFAETTQKENDYKLHFAAPLYKALFRQNQLIIKKERGRVNGWKDQNGWAVVCFG